MTTTPQKITFGEMRASGVRDVLIYCRDHRCTCGRSSRDFAHIHRRRFAIRLPIAISRAAKGPRPNDKRK